MYKTVDNRGRNNSSLSNKHFESNKSVLQSNQVAFKDFKSKMLKVKNIKNLNKLVPKRKSSKRLVKLKKIDTYQGQSGSINLNRFGRSSSQKRGHQRTTQRNNLANRTIEYHEKTMIEEYTDANIPEFTLGPDTFVDNERPKPLSVNRMGFYEDCRTLEAKISPIKKSTEPGHGNSLNLNLEKLKSWPEGSDQKFKESEDEFYDNKDILSNQSSSRQDSTKKYIELVDSFRAGCKNTQFETPSFKIQTEETDGNNNENRFEDVLKDESKNTQRSCNLLRYSSEMQTNRRSSATRAESDVLDSFRPKSRRLKTSYQNLKIYQTGQSMREAYLGKKAMQVESRNMSFDQREGKL